MLCAQGAVTAVANGRESLPEVYAPSFLGGRGVYNDEEKQDEKKEK